MTFNEIRRIIARDNERLRTVCHQAMTIENIEGAPMTAYEAAMLDAQLATHARLGMLIELVAKR